MSTLVLRCLGDTATAHLLDWLRQGDALSTFAAKQIEQRKGYIYTLVFDTVTDKELIEFEFGGKTNAAALRWVSEQLYAQAVGAGTLLLVENVTAEPDDDWIQQLDRPKTFFYNQHVYHVELLNDSSPSLIRDAILTGENVGPPVCCLVAQASLGAIDLLKGRHLFAIKSDSDALALVQNVTAAVLGAYDGEGYLLWVRSPLTS